MRAPLNLASRPFRNQTLPAILLGLAWIALLALTTQHALVLRRLLPSRTTALDRELANLEAEVSRLRSEAARLRAPRPDGSQIAQWALLKELVDRRSLSWAELLARLEEVLPPDVRLVSILPSVKEGEVQLELAAVVRSPEAALAFVRTLEERSEFEDVLPVRTSEATEGEEVRYTMRYRPPPAPPAEAPGTSEGEGPSGATKAARSREGTRW